MTILVLIHSPFGMWTIPLEHVEHLRRAFPAHTFLHATDDAAGLRLAGGADVAFSSQLRPDHLRAAPRLRWVHSPAAGVGGMLFPEMVASAVIVTNSRGIASDTIAEHVIAMILALFRRLPLAVRRQWERVWAQEELSAPPGNRMLAGSTVVVIGLGGIGSAVARRLDALGAYVIGVRRRGSEAVGGVARVHVSGEIPGLLPAADVVVIAAPQTHQTRGMFGRAALGAMKPDAILVNVSRGGLVDEDALAEALAAGRLGGAALDVLQDEPLQPGSPLWHLPNVLITPHTSGFRHDHWDVVTELFSENLRRFLRGDTLLNLVDKSAGY